MKVTLHGSGDWQGCPAPFCDCRVCVHAAGNSRAPEHRTRPALSVTTEKTSILVEASPDLRMQFAGQSLQSLQHIFISHWHFDHMFGLYELHAIVELLAQNTTIYCSSYTAEQIRQKLPHIPFIIKELAPFERVLIGDVEVMALPVFHTSEEKDISVNSVGTFGFRFESGGRIITYLADYFELPPKTLEKTSASNVVVADGTYLFENKYPEHAYQQAILEDHDYDHLHGDQIIEFTKSLGVKKVVYHSVSHLPQLMHDEMQVLLPPGHVLGTDNYEL